MGHMFDNTGNQTNNQWWDNLRAFGDQVDCSNPQTTSSWRGKSTRESFTCYSCDDPWVKVEPSRCQLFKAGDFLAVRRLNWDETINDDDNDEYLAYSEVHG
jgi:hypothetical protein